MKNKVKLNKLESAIVGATFIAAAPFIGLAFAIREVVGQLKKTEPEIIDDAEVVDK